LSEILTILNILSNPHHDRLRNKSLSIYIQCISNFNHVIFWTNILRVKQTVVIHFFKDPTFKADIVPALNLIQIAEKSRSLQKATLHDRLESEYRGQVEVIFESALLQQGGRPGGLPRSAKRENWRNRFFR
jgi:hypothetical protein